MYVAWTLATLAVAGYGLATAVWQLMLASLAFNALETAGTIVWATAKQRHVPAALLGRVSSLDWLISIGLLPLSFALTGPVSAAIGARETLSSPRVLGGVVTFAALLLPGMRARRGPRVRPARRLHHAGTTGRPTSCTCGPGAAASGGVARAQLGRGRESTGEARRCGASYVAASKRMPAAFLGRLPAAPAR